MTLLSVPRRLLPAWRRALLAQGRRMSMASMLQRAEKRAWEVACAAASRSPAYRRLLIEHGLNKASLYRGVPLNALPVLTKDNTFGRFSLAELAGALDPTNIADVLTSSGRGGDTFGLRLSNRRADDRAWFDMDLGLQDAFDVDRLPTLVVNCLPMGVVFNSRATAVANVSVREDMACAVLKQAGPAFAQTLVCTDPLFVNRLLDHAHSQGIDWSALNTSFVLGEEMLVEAQRTHIARRVGIDPEVPGHRMVGSSFGVGELGLNLLFETRQTIALRRALQQQPALAAAMMVGSANTNTNANGQQAVHGSATPALFCFNPLRCHVEVLPQGRGMQTTASVRRDELVRHGHGWGDLCLTLLDRQAVLPLPRYATGDIALQVSPQMAQAWAAATGLALPWLPMVAVLGRSADRLGGQPSVEDVKEAMYSDGALACCLTGAFRLSSQAGAEPSLLLQLKSPALQPAAQLRLAQLQDRLQASSGARIDVRCAADDAFDDRPNLDHERKFRYVGPSRQTATVPRAS